MVKMDKLVVAFGDKQNKAGFNALLKEAFLELGGAENNAVDTLNEALIEADIKLKKTKKECRASLIGKLGVMGVKQIVKKKTPATKKDPNEPTKKDLIKSLVSLLGVELDEVDTLNNMRKGDIVTLINAVKVLKED